MPNEISYKELEALLIQKAENSTQLLKTIGVLLAIIDNDGNLNKEIVSDLHSLARYEQNV